MCWDIVLKVLHQLLQSFDAFLYIFTLRLQHRRIVLITLMLIHNAWCEMQIVSFAVWIPTVAVLTLSFSMTLILSIRCLLHYRILFYILLYLFFDKTHNSDQQRNMKWYSCISDLHIIKYLWLCSSQTVNPGNFALYRWFVLGLIRNIQTVFWIVETEQCI